jgi:hypothetical protein
VDAVYTDITNIKTDVSSSTQPSTMFGGYFNWPDATHEKQQSGNVLSKAIMDRDMDAFHKLYAIAQKYAPDHVSPDSLIWTILEADNPEVLDYHIRHSGAGVSFDEKDQESSSTTEAKSQGTQDRTPQDERVYDGLMVRGIKHKELARRGDPNAKPKPQPLRYVPLLWKAVQNFAGKIVDYLNSSKPRAAYEAYTSNFDTARARYLRGILATSTELPRLLGWTMNSAKESPLIAAALANVEGRDDKLPEVIDILSTLQPQLFEEAINTP